VSPVTDAVAQSAELGWVLGVMTVTFFAAFVGWTLWAWWPANRARLDAAALLPLEDSP
jgi:cbb3-type cytochrome oxidase subunit 3